MDSSKSSKKDKVVKEVDPDEVEETPEDRAQRESYEKYFGNKHHPKVANPQEIYEHLYNDLSSVPSQFIKGCGMIVEQVNGVKAVNDGGFIKEALSLVGMVSLETEKALKNELGDNPQNWKWEMLVIMNETLDFMKKSKDTKEKDLEESTRYLSKTEGLDMEEEIWHDASPCKTQEQSGPPNKSAQKTDDASRDDAKEGASQSSGQGHP